MAAKALAPGKEQERESVTPERARDRQDAAPIATSEAIRTARSLAGAPVASGSLSHVDSHCTPGGIVALQRLAGNAAVARALGDRNRMHASSSPAGRPGASVQRLEDDAQLANPLDQRRDAMPTSGGVATEIAKPVGVGAATGATYLGAHNLGTANSTTNNAGQISSGGSLAGEVMGGALLADAGMSLYSGYQQRQGAQKRGDRAGVRLGNRKMKGAGWAVGAGAVGATAGGMKIASAFGSHAVGLGAGIGALGIVGGAAGVAQGGWRMGKAIGKLYDLSGITPFSAKGRSWKSYIQGRESRKAGVNALKVAAGALGIAAGALLLASNPVGWAVGIAGMAVGGALAAGKLFNKISTAWKARNTKKEMEKEGKMDALKQAQTPEQQRNDPGRRKEVGELAKSVAQRNSENARHAAAMIAALGKGDPRKLNRLIQLRDHNMPADKDLSVTRATLARTRPELTVGEEDVERYDAEALLAALNVDPAHALSESGQDLIQRKLSVSESA
ncbi:MAG: hypothetical protein JWM85_1357 [Acidimicrobiaceae bacterium]|nr:hypothetical protein [Acidimicrobiaceae bacterium]